MLVKMSRTLKFCIDCNGTMVKPSPIHSYDFNTEGVVPFYCNSCGLCNDVEEIIPVSNVVLTKFSNQFVETIIKILCNRGKSFSYKKKDTLYRRLKDKNLFSPYDFADLLIDECKDIGIVIEWEYVINSIYSRCGAYLNMDSYHN